MIMEPAKSNVINLNGAIVTPALITFCWGFGHAIGEKVKLVGIGTPQYTSEYLAARDRQEEWFGY